MPHPIATFLPNKDLDPWIEALSRRDYRTRRLILWKRLTPRLSRFLYKYREFDGPYALTNLRDMIVGSMLRLNRPSDFNDPFDMAAHFVMHSTAEQRQARFEALAREQAPERGYRAQQAAVQRLMTATDSELASVCQASLARIKQTTGLFCFAGNAKSTLMWSHYAAKHTGICLQFERAQDFATFGHALAVDYLPDLPVINWIVGFHEGISSMLFSKHPSWAYEEESRIVIYDQAARYLPFRPEALRGIVFGCRISNADAATVDNLLSERVAAGYPAVKTCLATQHPTKYKLVIRERPAIRT